MATQTQGITTRTDHNIWAGISYDDALGARAWLRALGFAEGILVQEDDGTVTHSEMMWPEGGRVRDTRQADLCRGSGCPIL